MANRFKCYGVFFLWLVVFTGVVSATNATYDSSSNQLTIPYVDVPGFGQYSITFDLLGAEPWDFVLSAFADAEGATVPAAQGRYSADNHRLILPRVETSTGLYQVELLEVLDATETTFRLLEANQIELSPTTTQLWNEEGQQIEEMLTSSSTLNLGAFYRMYRLNHEGISYMDSSDGLSFTTAVSTGIRPVANTAKHFIRNPAVIRLAENNYLLIYEGMDAEDNPKLFRATSSDGRNFTDYTGPLADGAVLIPEGDENNFMSVPDMIVWNGKLYIYYVANFTEVFYAYSEDEGQSWIKGGRITINGLSEGDKYVDPDLVVLPDNSLRLYFAHTDKRGNFGDQGILEAASEDGVNFTVTGQIIATTGQQIKLDPDVVERIDQPGKYRVYFGFDETQQNAFALFSAQSP